MISDRKRIYNQAFKKHGFGWAALCWARKRCMTSRHKLILKQEDFSGKKVLDIGSGLGDFYKRLVSNKQIPAFFMGIEENQDFVKYCRKHYPDCVWINRTFEDWRYEGKWDIVVLSGVFATVKNLQSFMKRLLAIKTKVLIFDCLDKDLYSGTLNSFKKRDVQAHLWNTRSKWYIIENEKEQMFMFVVRRMEYNG